jgi:hypothetical protein
MMNLPFSKRLKITITGILLMFFVVPVIAFQGDSPDQLFKVSLRLSEQSYFVINGKTNVNSFQCNYSNVLKTGVQEMEAFYDDGCIYFKNAFFNLNTSAFDCGNKLMNKDFRDLLKADKHPDLEIQLDCIKVGDGSSLHTLPVASNARSRINEALVSAHFNIAGQIQDYQFPVEIVQKGKDRMYTGTLVLNIRDFEIDPPKKMMGMIVVDEWIEIDFYVIVSLIE